MNWDEGTWDSASWDAPSPPVFTPLPSARKRYNPKTMAANPTPDDDDVLCALAEDLADGCALHEVAIGIKQNNEAVLRAAITAVSQQKQLLGAGRAALDTAIVAHEARDKEAGTLLMNCKLRLAKLFGSRWSAAWEPTGFPGQSTAVPGTMDQRFSLLNSLVTYFTANPASESAEGEATAALCTAKHTQVSNARQAVNVARTTLTTRKKDMEAALRTLRKRVRGLIDELGTLIADDDERYSAFGLNIPALPVAPVPIPSLTAAAVGGGKVHLQWPYSTRMAGTRLQKKVIGVDEEFVSAGTADGLEKTLVGFTAGQSVVFRVIAYNDGGDANPSPEATVVVT